jgi:hypothetical protein
MARRAQGCCLPAVHFGLGKLRCRYPLVTFHAKTNGIKALAATGRVYSELLSILTSFFSLLF